MTGLHASSVIAASIALFLVFRCWRSSKQRFPSPPGPKPLPLIGNMLDMPHRGWWLTFDTWFKQYGEIVSVSLMGQRIIFLGSAKVTHDLLEKRSAKYSDRGTSHMVHEILGWDWNFSFMRYGERWRKHRRLFSQYFGPAVVPNYHHLQNKYTALLLQRLLEAPDQFSAHLRYTFTGTIMETVYGIEIREYDDPYVIAAEVAISSLSETGMFGAYLVDIFPWLEHMPSWFPGTGYRKKAEYWIKYIRAMKDDPYQAVQEKMARRRHEAKPCVTKEMLEDMAEVSETEEMQTLIKNTVGLAYGAGADTIVSAAHTFILAMASYPKVQAKAQAEIDSIVGHGQLPSFNDQSNLPYVNAIVKEVLRWQNVAPVAIPHAVSEDDVYEGYFIPKGSIVIGNTWSLAHDPKDYPKPYEFIPERFIREGQLNPEVRDPATFAFGYGRRTCPGRYFALNALYSIASNVLACYTIEPPLDENGNWVKLSSRSTIDGLLSSPEPFKVVIKPRYEGAKVLIENAVADARNM